MKRAGYSGSTPSGQSLASGEGTDMFALNRRTLLRGMLAEVGALVASGQLPHQDTYELRVSEWTRTATIPGVAPR